jgi:hypothetical protein
MHPKQKENKEESIEKESANITNINKLINNKVNIHNKLNK